MNAVKTVSADTAAELHALASFSEPDAAETLRECAANVEYMARCYTEAMAALEAVYEAGRMCDQSRARYCAAIAALKIGKPMPIIEHSLICNL